MNQQQPVDESRIVAVILTLNEAGTVAAAISSLAWVGAEIFVVDSGSLDGTVDIAQSMGVTVLEHKQQGPFLISDQRNWAVANIQSDADWMLFLDADEESTPMFEKCVRDATKSTSGVDCYYAAPAFMYHGKWLKRTSGYPNWHPRLIRRTSDARFTGGVWEDFAPGARSGNLLVPYLHFTNRKGPSDWFEKHERYAQWEAKQIVGSKLRSSEAVRRGLARRARYALGPIRKYAALMHLAVLRGGLLDGRAGRSYMHRMFIYELMIDAHVDELRALAKDGVR